jgi:hypothetical protein
MERQEKIGVNFLRFRLASVIILLFVVSPLGKAVNASQTSEKDGMVIVNVTWKDNTSANGIYVEAHAYVVKYRAQKSFVLKMFHAGEYTVSLPPGIYDVFVSESSSWPSCRRLVINPGAPTHWQLKLEVDDVHMGNSAGNPTKKR